MPQHYALLPEELSMNDQQTFEEREREMERLNDRIRQLEAELSQTKGGLGNTPTVLGVSSNTLMFGVIVGLVVYIIVNNGKAQRAKKPWWEKV